MFTIKSISNLLTWTRSPNLETLPDVLADLSSGDLIMSMAIFKNDPAGRLAWAEWGRRAGYFDFQIKPVIAEGRLTIRFESKAEPIHHGAAFEVKKS